MNKWNAITNEIEKGRKKNLKNVEKRKVVVA